MPENEFLTREGYERLQEELLYLRTVKRPQIAEHIRIAKEDGDLSENAGYDAAKNEQAFIEGRILTVDALLKNAQIIERNGDVEMVSIGSRVTVQEEDYEPETYEIVGSTEANPGAGRISNVSPLGQALLGRRVGHSVEISAPVGATTFTILAIR